MAGKTFPGIGDQEDEAPPVDPADAADSGAGNSRPFYSGPTVVDDLKVEEGLKKLRSLDVPLGGLTGITKAVVEAIESAPISVPIEMGPPPPPWPPTPAQVVANQMRETAVGRNVVGPTAGQQEIPAPFDDRALRGTLFGHSIHAPEFALPAPEEPPIPGALALLNRGAPTTTVAVHQPHTSIPPEAEPFQRPNRYRDTPLTPIAADEGPPRKRVMKRVVIGTVGIAVIVGAALVWTRTGDDPEGSPASAPASPNRLQGTTSSPGPVAAPAALPVAASPVAAPPPAAPAPAAAARESEPEPIPAIEPPPTHPVRPSARHAAPPSDPAAEEAEPSERPHHTHATASHTDRHHGSPEGDKTDKSPESETAPGKPAHAGKRAPEDDPDATMAPSIE